jgi:hypothetical protein
MATEYLWHGQRYWVTNPIGNQHIGWNTRFEQCEVLKKTATRVHVLSPSCGKLLLNRLKLERDGKVYHSRVHEYFYSTRPAVDPEKHAQPFHSFIASRHTLSPAFAELNLRPGCSRTDIVRAYRQLAKIHHPDAGGSAQAFARLQAAYTQALAITR